VVEGIAVGTQLAAAEFSPAHPYVHGSTAAGPRRQLRHLPDVGKIGSVLYHAATTTSQPAPSTFAAKVKAVNLEGEHRVSTVGPQDAYGVVLTMTASSTTV